MYTDEWFGFIGLWKIFYHNIRNEHSVVRFYFLLAIITNRLTKKNQINAR